MEVNGKKKTHYKGLIGELEFTLHLLKIGWNVFSPIDQNSRTDLVAEKEGSFKKIQIKFCTPYKGCLRVDLEHPGRSTDPYSEKEVDEIGLFDPLHNKFYLVPLKDILPRKEIWLRVDSLAKNKKQEKNIHWAFKYEI